MVKIKIFKIGRKFLILNKVLCGFMLIVFFWVIVEFIFFIVIVDFFIILEGFVVFMFVMVILRCYLGYIV